MSSISSDSISPGQNRSFPFSISAILSDEMGQKKSPPASCTSTPYSVDAIKSSVHSASNHHAFETPKRPRKSSTSFLSNRTTPKMPLSDTVKAQPNYQAFGSSKAHEGLRGGQHTATYFTPHKPPASTYQMNSNHISPFNPKLLVALGHRPSPSRDERDELFGETSLNMLSEVAHYHSELSSADSNSMADSTVREKFSNIKLLSTSDDVEASTTDARNASFNIRSRKTATPSILKRDKRRRRVSSGGSACMNSSTDEEPSSSHQCPQQSHLNAGFLSPLSSEKLSNKDLGFSPSIFLSRPDNSHSDSLPPLSSNSPVSSDPTSDPKADSSSSHDCSEQGRHMECARWSTSPGYESDCPHGNSMDQLSSSVTNNKNKDDFTTSTPIKMDKENLKKSNGSGSEEVEGTLWSPTVQHSGGRKHLREANDYCSGTEYEAMKKPRLPTPTQKPPQLQQQSRKKSKARTKLSPLLENSYSPIFKDGHLPSPLTNALATTPTRGLPYGVISNPANTLLSQLPSQLPTLSSSAVPTVSQPPRSFLAPPASRPTSLFGAGTIGRAPGGALLGTQSLLSTSSPNPTIQFSPFQGVSGLLNPSKDRLQISTQPPSQAMVGTIPLSQIHQSSLAFNPLATACGTQPMQGYNSTSVITPTNIAHPNYVPLVMTAPTQPLPPPSCLYAPYTSNTPLVTLDRTSEQQQQLNSSVEKKALQSVPPWFIFSNNRSEKRSRLTEAINKSLSETPLQPSKLPEEWTKLACGQTKDQKTLTEKARMFLHLRPRQLTFSSEAD